MPNFEDREFTQSIETVNISEELAEKAIDRVTPIKSQGPDKVHPRFLQQTKDTIKKSLTIFFYKNH